MSTGDAYLEEANTWGDQYWGTVKGVGDNVLGRIIMEVRQEIQFPMEARKLPAFETLM